MSRTLFSKRTVGFPEARTFFRKNEFTTQELPGKKNKKQFSTHVTQKCPQRQKIAARGRFGNLRMFWLCWTPHNSSMTRPKLSRTVLQDPPALPETVPAILGGPYPALSESLPPLSAGLSAGHSPHQIMVNIVLFIMCVVIRVFLGVSPFFSSTGVYVSFFSFSGVIFLFFVFSPSEHLPSICFLLPRRPRKTSRKPPGT